MVEDGSQLVRMHEADGNQDQIEEKLDDVGCDVNSSRLPRHRLSRAIQAVNVQVVVSGDDLEDYQDDKVDDGKGSYLNLCFDVVFFTSS